MNGHQSELSIQPDHGINIFLKHCFPFFSYKHTHCSLRGYPAVRYQTESTLAVWHTYLSPATQRGRVVFQKRGLVKSTFYSENRCGPNAETKWMNSTIIQEKSYHLQEWLFSLCWIYIYIQKHNSSVCILARGLSMKLVWCHERGQNRLFPNRFPECESQSVAETWNMSMSELTDADVSNCTTLPPSCMLMANNGSTRWEVELSCQTSRCWGSKITEGKFSINT